MTTPLTFADPDGDRDGFAMHLSALSNTLYSAATTAPYSWEELAAAILSGIFHIAEAGRTRIVSDAEWSAVGNGTNGFGMVVGRGLHAESVPGLLLVLMRLAERFSISDFMDAKEGLVSSAEVARMRESLKDGGVSVVARIKDVVSTTSKRDMVSALEALTEDLTRVPVAATL